ncbi:MAG: class I SAM-dependent methyltransferase [Vulcanimicrobiaceae bacterium]
MPNSERSDGRRFDRDYGVTTQAILFLSDLDPDDVGDAGYHATHYEGVPVADFRALLALVPADAIAGSTFVDVGAGMGRALILASELPFLQVVGVEVSASLYEVARENLETARCPLRRCNDVRIVRADARIWNYPPGDLVVFLYNPFDASALEITLGSIVSRRRNGATWLIYHTPVHREIIEADKRFHIVAEIPCGIIYRYDHPNSD